MTTTQLEKLIKTVVTRHLKALTSDLFEALQEEQGASGKKEKKVRRQKFDDVVEEDDDDDEKIDFKKVKSLKVGDLKNWMKSKGVVIPTKGTGSSGGVKKADLVDAVEKWMEGGASSEVEETDDEAVEISEDEKTDSEDEKTDSEDEKTDDSNLGLEDEEFESVYDSDLGYWVDLEGKYVVDKNTDSIIAKIAGGKKKRLTVADVKKLKAADIPVFDDNSGRPTLKQVEKILESQPEEDADFEAEAEYDSESDEEEVDEEVDEEEEELEMTKEEEEELEMTKEEEEELELTKDDEEEVEEEDLDFGSDEEDSDIVDDLMSATEAALHENVADDFEAEVKKASASETVEKLTAVKVAGRRRRQLD